MATDSRTESPVGASKEPNALIRCVLFDFEDEDGVLDPARYHVQSGTLGGVIEVDRTERWFQLGLNGQLPSSTGDADLVIVDLMPRPGSSPSTPPRGIDGWWMQGSSGMIDHRLVAAQASGIRDVVSSGGLLVIFTDAPIGGDRTFARHDEYNGFQRISTNYPLRDVHQLADGLDQLWLLQRSGDIVRPTSDCDRELEALLSSFHFTASIATGSQAFIPLATSKHEDVVAGLVRPDGHRRGWTLLLPQTNSKPAVLDYILNHLAPSLIPSVFGIDSAAMWLSEAPYELTQVVQLEKEIADIRESAEREMKLKQAEIAKLREEHAYLRVLLTGTGECLEVAAKMCFEELGFQVIRVDEHQSASELKAEDLRIEEPGFVMLIEVKGVGGVPKESDLLQVTKHLASTMHRVGHANVFGLTLSNHERGRPPLERTAKPFQSRVIPKAEKDRTTLMSSWDMFLLLQNAKEFNWPKEAIRSALMTFGQFRMLPGHYRELGDVKVVFKERKVIGLQTRLGVERGDRIAVVNQGRALEIIVESIQLNDVNVLHAPPGSKAGLLVGNAISQFHPGTTVYLVDTEVLSETRPAG